MAEKDLRVIKTRRTIRGALIELMGEKELGSITVSELSARAMVNRKTFYRHYRTVSDVVTELENEILSEFSDILKSGNKSVLDVGTVFRDISRLITKRKELFDLMKLNPDIFNNGKIKAMLRRALEVSLRNIDAIDDENTLSAVSEFMVSGVLSLYAGWIDGGCRGDLEFLTEISVKMVTEGLRGFIADDKLSAISL